MSTEQINLCNFDFEPDHRFSYSLTYLKKRFYQFLFKFIDKKLSLYRHHCLQL